MFRAVDTWFITILPPSAIARSIGTTPNNTIFVRNDILILLPLLRHTSASITDIGIRNQPVPFGQVNNSGSFCDRPAVNHRQARVSRETMFRTEAASQTAVDLSTPIN